MLSIHFAKRLVNSKGRELNMICDSQRTKAYIYSWTCNAQVKEASCNLPIILSVHLTFWEFQFSMQNLWIFWRSGFQEGYIFTTRLVDLCKGKEAVEPVHWVNSLQWTFSYGILGNFWNPMSFAEIAIIIKSQESEREARPVPLQLSFNFRS